MAGAPLHGGLQPGWGRDARQSNVRNFRFWLVLPLGPLFGALGLSFLVMPIVRGITESAQIAIGLPFGALMLWLCYCVLSFKPSKAYSWLAGLAGVVLAVALLMVPVIYIPMNDPQNAQYYGKPAVLPPPLHIGMALGAVYMMFVAYWMGGLTPPERQAVQQETQH